MTWVKLLTHWATRRPVWVLVGVGLVTVVSGVIATGLGLRMNWIDLLPSDRPVVQLYRDIQERFGEASLVVALEGDRDAIVAMAEELAPRLDTLQSLRNVVGKAPTDFLLDHGFVLLRPDQFDRALRTFDDWTLTGVLRGINDDYEREYTDSESNMRRDEVDIARNVLGLTRALELVGAAAAGRGGPDAMVEAADAISIGDPWMLSLDRRMVLLVLTPQANAFEIDRSIATVEQVEAIIGNVAPRHPLVRASTTGMAKIGQDEMNSVGGYTVVLSMVALVLIYLLLARTFGGWVMPLLALTPLVMGILWTMAALEFLFDDLNLFTAMMMLVLLGVGIDFSIHVIARFQEEMRRGTPLNEALAATLGTSGVAVIIGALTTALAFFTLVVGETKGVHEFGVAAGLGVLFTLAAILVTLPALLALRHRVGIRRGTVDAGVASASDGYRWIGDVAAAGWRRPGLYLAGTVVVVAGSVWGLRHTAYEYDFLELEAKGLRSVELQREIPKRFGVSDHGDWVVTQTIEESREVKEALRLVPEVGEVYAISDYVPSPERLERYGPPLRRYRRETLGRERQAWRPGDGTALARETERLWDNLDLMSNLAYAAGLDRIVGVIDQMTGLDAETGETDAQALLPTLTRVLGAGVSDEMMRPLADAWATRLRQNLERMSNPGPVALSELPGSVSRSFTPKAGGEGFLVQVVPRRYLWDRASLERFAAQTEAVRPDVVGSEKMMLVMMDETLQDGAEAALLALAVIAALLVLYFRGPVGLVALIPLAVGSLAMLGLMYVFGMKYNYMNLIATPIILGLGIDDGVHALHRLRERGDLDATSVGKSFRSVGKAILLTSVTTMIGFGSVAFYEMRGMASFGQVLFIGVGACFVATIFVLPAVMWVVTGQWRVTARKDVGHAVS